jgi:hypothetical protein
VSEQLKYLGVWLGLGAACALAWVGIVYGFMAVTS